MNNQRPNFNSPPIMYQARHNFQKSPNMYQGNCRFTPRNSPYQSPYTPPNIHVPRNSSPFLPGYRSSPRSFNNSTGSSDQWSVRANLSYSSDSSSSSYYGDVSQFSPYNSPHRNSGSPYHSQNRNKHFQGKRNLQSPGSSDSNTGHSYDIRIYVHSSMLEDPWKDLMAEMEKKN